MQQEDSDSKSGNKSNGSPKNFDDDENDDDDEMIDIGDECPSDDEMVDNCAWKLFHREIQLLIAFDWSIIFTFFSSLTLGSVSSSISQFSANHKQKNAFLKSWQGEDTLSHWK